MKKIWPVIKVWCLPEMEQADLEAFYRSLAEIAGEILGLKREEMTFLFPKDMMQFGVSAKTSWWRSTASAVSQLVASTSRTWCAPRHAIPTAISHVRSEPRSRRSSPKHVFRRTFIPSTKKNLTGPPSRTEQGDPMCWRDDVHQYRFCSSCGAEYYGDLGHRGCPKIPASMGGSGPEYPPAPPKPEPKTKECNGNGYFVELIHDTESAGEGRSERHIPCKGCAACRPF